MTQYGVIIWFNEYKLEFIIYIRKWCYSLWSDYFTLYTWDISKILWSNFKYFLPPKTCGEYHILGLIYIYIYIWKNWICHIKLLLPWESQQALYVKWHILNVVGKFGPQLIELTSFKLKLLIRFIVNKTC